MHLNTLRGMTDSITLAYY